MSGRFVLPALAALALLGASIALALRGQRQRGAVQESLRDDLEALVEESPAPDGFIEDLTIGLPEVEPTAVAVDGHGTIHVAAGDAILAYDSQGVLVSSTPVPAPVRALTIGPEGEAYLAFEDHIGVHAADGGFERWSPLGERAIITSLALGGDRLFAADAGNRVVWSFDTRGSLVDILLRAEQGGDDPGLVVPSPFLEVAVAGEGPLWVTNPGMQRVERVTRDGLRIDYWGEAATEIEGFCGCCNPIHIALCPDGTLVTSEKGIPRVKQYCADGELSAVVAGTHWFEPDTVGLDLACDPTGRVVVLDPDQGVVRVFAARPPQPGGSHDDRG